MVDDVSATLAVMLMALVTLAMRVGGVWIMSKVAMTPRVEAFLKAMAASVFISIVVPSTLSASPRIWLAVAAAMAVMALTRSSLAAMVIGMACAALGRSFGL